MRVTVIMGIYNCASTLSEAIDSLLHQTCPDWKLIMCDDGSSDGTVSVAERYRSAYPEKIFLIRNEQNMGLNVTLNRCLSLADTEYIARMDGDDISLPERFSEEIGFLDAHPEYAIVSTPMIYFDDNGDFSVGTGGKEPQPKEFPRGTPFCHAPCMVRKEAYEAVGGYAVSEKRLRVEDWDLWIRMYEQGYKGYVLENPLYKMRDDRNAFRRRKYRYRINEARVSASAVKKLRLPLYQYVWLFRPLLVGLLPNKLYLALHRKKTNGA